jgi:asparagine synthase (glutamine-hydrolysing)
MCGIAGFVSPAKSFSSAELEDLAFTMVATLRHRGPDDKGVWTDPNTGVTLGHCRLAIQDLSAEGHQPMQSADNRYILVLNGEIYNFRQLRALLESTGHAFRGHSDTEVMLAAFSEYGVETALKSFVGMFAFALWDRREQRLYLARDRAGEKPLYYGWNEGVFFFGSELKALRAFPRFQGEVDLEALRLFIRHNYIPAPHSIYRNIFKLPPGTLISLNMAQFESRELPVPQAYWSLWAAAQAGLANPFRGDAGEAVDHLTRLLRESVALQLVADVPVGAFLSGGIDSSTIVALMQAQSSRPIKTFSIGFANREHNEAHFAAKVANHLETQHTELYIHPGTLLEVIPRMPQVYDEPFADSSQIPTLLLCELARKQVTVSLSGDGGDELFGGYALYQRAQQIWNVMRRIPGPIRKYLAGFLGPLTANGITLQGLFRSEPRLLKRLSRLSDLLPVSDDQSLYQMLIAQCRHCDQWLLQATPGNGKQSSPIAWESFPDLLHRMMCQDFLTYLPDEVLVKVDRAAMAVSLETRIPLLDHRIVEFAWSLPVSLKQRGRQGKWLLRQVLYRYVPPQLVERPKQGFAAPVEQWLRKELRPWAEELLDESRLRQEGFFQERTIRRKWDEHLCGKGDWGRPLWNVLMFQAWWEAQKGQKKPATPAPVSTTRPAVTSLAEPTLAA